MSKTHTDYEQSKRLAEILPLNSADCFYRRFTNHYNAAQYTLEMYPYNKGADKKHDLPCWSLASLLDVLPKEVNIEGQRYAPCLFPVIDGHWLLKLWYNSNETITSPIAIFEDNPVDVYYEMIVKLNKLKLL